MGMDDALPKTRWELGESHGYARHFGQLIAEGADIDGEARLADALVERGAVIMDAGAGMGRVGAALAVRGHRVLAVEKDPALVADAARRYPELPMLASDLLALSPARLRDAGHPEAFDLITLVGNVIVLAAPQTEVRMLATLRDLLAPGGRIVVGFHPRRAHGSARDYPVSEFAADVAAADLAIDHRFGSYQLAPPSDDYCVALLSVT